MTRDEVFRRLVTLGVGLNVTFVLWGVLQVGSKRVAAVGVGGPSPPFFWSVD